MLSKEELVGAFVQPGGCFELVLIQEGRFDPTPVYGALPPLCWVALFRRL